MRLTYVCGSDARAVRARLLQHVKTATRRIEHDRWVVVGREVLKNEVGEIVGRPPFEEDGGHFPALAYWKAVKYNDPDAIVFEIDNHSAWAKGREDLSFWRTLPETALYAAACGHIVLAELVAGSVEEAVLTIAEDKSRSFMWDELITCEFDGQPFTLSRDV